MKAAIVALAAKAAEKVGLKLWRWGYERLVERELERSRVALAGIVRDARAAGHLADGNAETGMDGES